MESSFTIVMSLITKLTNRATKNVHDPMSKIILAQRRKCASEFFLILNIYLNFNLL